MSCRFCENQNQVPECAQPVEPMLFEQVDNSSRNINQLFDRVSTLEIQLLDARSQIERLQQEVGFGQAKAPR